VDNLIVPDRKLQKDRKMPVSLVLIFADATDVDVFMTATPVFRQSLIESLQPLGDEIELQIGAFFHHLPGFGTPCISRCMKEVRGQAGHACAVLWLQFIVAMPVTFDRKIEGSSFLTKEASLPNSAPRR
jgi:hypothetical protein